MALLIVTPEYVIPGQLSYAHSNTCFSLYNHCKKDQFENDSFYDDFLFSAVWNLDPDLYDLVGCWFVLLTLLFTFPSM